jgi:hypothetical protein
MPFQRKQKAYMSKKTSNAVEIRNLTEGVNNVSIQPLCSAYSLNAGVAFSNPLEENAKALESDEDHIFPFTKKILWHTTDFLELKVFLDFIEANSAKKIWVVHVGGGMYD